MPAKNEYNRMMLFWRDSFLFKNSQYDAIIKTLGMKCGYYSPYQTVRIETKVAAPINGRQINQVLNWVKGPIF